MADFVGPALPPGFAKKRDYEVTSSETEKNSSNTVGTGVTGARAIGPVLPEGPTGRRDDEDGEDHERELMSGQPSIGPALPPSLGGVSTEIQIPSTSGSEEGRGSYGPSLPPQTSIEGSRHYGPSLPPGLDQGEDTSDDEAEGDFVGPALPTAGEKELARKRKKTEIEMRAETMKNRLTGKDSEECDRPQREEWMTELPPDVKAFGLGPRKFRTSNFDPGDRSVWTDTPAERLRRAQDTASGKRAASKKKDESHSSTLSARDKELLDQVTEHNRKFRSEPLVKIHRKRKAEEGQGQTERRPFDRETDLQIHKSLSPAKKQAVMKSSAKYFGSKFTHGDKRFL